MENLRESCGKAVEIAWKSLAGRFSTPPETAGALAFMGTRGIDREGQFIVLEGIDGVGKTTLARNLVQSLRQEGIDCETASFPGQELGTLAAHIYRLYHNPRRFGVRSINQSAIQLLLTAAHIETIETKILPALAAGRTVVLDRFWWSTWVYGRASGVSQELLAKLLQIEDVAWRNVVPTRVFLVARSTPDGRKAYSSSMFAQLSTLYRSLARREAARGVYPVSTLNNDRSVKQAVTTMRSRLRA